MAKEEEIGVLTVGVSGRRRRGGEEDLVEALVGDVLVDEELVVGAVGAVADEVDDVAVLDAGEEGGLVAELAGALAGPGAEALDGDLPAVGEAAAVDGAEPALPELLPLGEPPRRGAQGLVPERALLPRRDRLQVRLLLLPPPPLRAPAAAGGRRAERPCDALQELAGLHALLPPCLPRRGSTCCCCWRGRGGGGGVWLGWGLVGGVGFWVAVVEEKCFRDVAVGVGWGARRVASRAHGTPRRSAAPGRRESQGDCALTKWAHRRVCGWNRSGVEGLKTTRKQMEEDSNPGELSRIRLSLGCVQFAKKNLSVTSDI